MQSFHCLQTFPKDFADSKSCIIEQDCERNECCVALSIFQVPQKGICVELSMEGQYCSDRQAKLKYFGGKYILQCPCKEGLACLLQENISYTNTNDLPPTVFDQRCRSAKSVSLIKTPDKGIEHQKDYPGKERHALLTDSDKKKQSSSNISPKYQLEISSIENKEEINKEIWNKELENVKYENGETKNDKKNAKSSNKHVAFISKNGNDIKKNQIKGRNMNNNETMSKKPETTNVTIEYTTISNKGSEDTESAYKLENSTATDSEFNGNGFLVEEKEFYQKLDKMNCGNTSFGSEINESNTDIYKFVNNESPISKTEFNFESNGTSQEDGESYEKLNDEIFNKASFGDEINKTTTDDFIIKLTTDIIVSNSEITETQEEESYKNLNEDIFSNASFGDELNLLSTDKFAINESRTDITEIGFEVNETQGEREFYDKLNEEIFNAVSFSDEINGTTAYAFVFNESTADKTELYFEMNETQEEREFYYKLNEEIFNAVSFSDEINETTAYAFVFNESTTDKTELYFEMNEKNDGEQESYKILNDKICTNTSFGDEINETISDTPVINESPTDGIATNFEMNQTQEGEKESFNKVNEDIVSNTSLNKEINEPTIIAFDINESKYKKIEINFGTNRSQHEEREFYEEINEDSVSSGDEIKESFTDTLNSKEYSIEKAEINLKMNETQQGEEFYEKINKLIFNDSSLDEEINKTNIDVFGANESTSDKTETNPDTNGIHQREKNLMET
ncbi:unnamed protein product [Larinioides sclopetarius]|uniref:Prokineticin domain-containing protein n=1 Tax=Larinioides sclopetarius TaxID=280406 RepID=A0AAV1ZMM7_9ARAC